MARNNRRNGSKNPLLGKIEGRQLHAAAKEILAFADVNTRRFEIDSREASYSKSRPEVFFLKQKLPNGAWRAFTLEKVGGVVLDVQRTLECNLEPALKKDAILCVGRAGMFHDFESAKRYVLDDVDFKCAGVV